MKDGFATVYVSFEDLVEFICKQAGINYEDTVIVLGRPRNLTEEEVEFPIAFSDTGVPPSDWGGTAKEKLDALISTWGGGE